jgi:ammonium transporter, Amt family
MLYSFGTLSTVSITWSLFGYSLAFGPGAGASAPFIGNLHYGFFDSRDKVREGTDVPEHAFMVFQLMFAIITAAVISGAIVGRMRVWAWLLFSTLWNIVVYIPLARWVFYPQGVLAAWGVLDFAGGIPVETASGVSALVLAFWLDRLKARRHSAAEHRDDDADVEEDEEGGVRGDDGKKRSEGAHHHAPPTPPHNVPFVLLGAGLLFFGWFGFNAGSALASGYLSSRAFANTHLAAAAAMAGWALSEIAWGGPKFGKGAPTAIGCATGVVVGLVAITPACGFVSQMISLLIGFTASPVCYWAHRGVHRLGVDDTLGCFPGHGVAGMFGILMTGLFASTDEGSPANGLAYGEPSLLGKQAAAIAIAVVVCGVGTTACYWAVWAVGRWAGVELVVEEGVHVDRELLGEVAYHGKGGGGMGEGAREALLN